MRPTGQLYENIHSWGLRTDFAAKQGISAEEALKKGMETKAVEFVKQGSEVYRKT